jgi:hypothetical protein
MDPITAGMLAGTALQVWGNWQASQAQAKQHELQAALNEAQAKETLERSRINTTEMLKEEAHLIGTQTSQFAKAGVDVGGATPLLVQAHTIMESRRQISNMQREAEFRAAMLRAGAASDMALAGETRKAGVLSGIGAGIDTGLRLYSLSSPNKPETTSPIGSYSAYTSNSPESGYRFGSSWAK